MANQETLRRKETPEETLSLVKVFDAFGLVKANTPIESWPDDTSIEAIQKKITNPQIARAMGASERTVSIVYGAELTANLLDSFSKTGERNFLTQADYVFQEMLTLIPSADRDLVLNLSRGAMTYFYFEAAVAQRIKSGDQFLDEEAIEYLLRRGADSTIYAAILQADGIVSPGMIAGFRARQALWDLRDDTEDLEQDRMTIGANVLLLSTRGNRRNLRRFAHHLLEQCRTLDIPMPLQKVIEQEYEITIAALH